MPNFSSNRTAPLLFRVIIGAVLLGCSDQATVWSTKAKSPDGRWLAEAHTDQYGGLGTAYAASVVTLHQINTRRSANEVLELQDVNSSVKVALVWKSANYLEITVIGAASRTFQAIRCGDVDILVRDAQDSSTVRPR